MSSLDSTAEIAAKILPFVDVNSLLCLREVSQAWKVAVGNFVLARTLKFEVSSLKVTKSATAILLIFIINKKERKRMEEVHAGRLFVLLQLQALLPVADVRTTPRKIWAVLDVATLANVLAGLKSPLAPICIDEVGLLRLPFEALLLAADFLEGRSVEMLSYAHAKNDAPPALQDEYALKLARSMEVREMVVGLAQSIPESMRFLRQLTELVETLMIFVQKIRPRIQKTHFRSLDFHRFVLHAFTHGRCRFLKAEFCANISMNRSNFFAEDFFMLGRECAITVGLKSQEGEPATGLRKADFMGIRIANAPAKLFVVRSAQLKYAKGLDEFFDFHERVLEKGEEEEEEETNMAVRMDTS